MGCCSRLKKECQLSLFSLEDTNGQTIDLHQSLAPKPRLLCGAIKACILCWFITFCTIEIFTDGRGLYWFIFLTHWGLLLMYLYMALTTFAFIRTVYLEKKNPDHSCFQLLHQNAPLFIVDPFFLFICICLLLLHFRTIAWFN